MKKLFFLLLTGALFFAMSCKTEDEPGVAALSSDEAAEVTGAAIGSNSGGASSYIETSTIGTTTSTTLRVGGPIVIEDSTFGAAGVYPTATTPITWDYSWTYQHLLYVTPIPTTIYSLPDSVKTTFAYYGNVDAPRFSSVHNGSGTFLYTSLGAVTLVPIPTYTIDSLWTMKGTFTRVATHTSKVSSKIISSTTTIVFSNTEVYTATHKIKSGTATVTVTGTVPEKGAFEYTGTVVFNSSSEGTLTIGGKTYTISTVTGEVK